LPIPLDEIRRRRRTEALRSALPYSARWEAWLEATGETAPDFDLLVPRAGLWSPVEGLLGAGEWPARTAAIRDRWRHWLLGSSPPPPDDAEADVMDERRENGAVDRVLELTFEGGAGHVRARLLLPDAQSALPVLLCPAGHDWFAAAALRRGWAACLVHDAADHLGEVYPHHDWSSLARRAWSLSRAVELLHHMPEIDPYAIVAAGYGSGGRAALLAAADDVRIAAVASSSSGVLGAIPARGCAERHGGPGIETLTRLQPDLFHPRLRFFAGREHLLPTDSHELLALVAPRPVLLSVAADDPEESTWAAERAVDAVRPAYELLGAPAGAISLRWSPGGHQPTPESLEGILDWAAHAVGRTGTGPETARRVHARQGISWPRQTAPHRAPLDARELGEALTAALGVVPPAAPPGLPDLGGPDVPATVDGVPVDVFLPPGVRRAPLALWLGPLCRASGYASPLEDGPAPWEHLVDQGWAVACFDPIGTGARRGEEAGFHRRHPDWSLLGRMVHDARAAIAAAATLPEVDATRPWLAGYGVGGLVALHLAALEPIIGGLAVAAPTAGDVPLLLAEPWYGLTDLLCALGNRPALVVSPACDAEADPADTGDAVRAAAGEMARVEHAVVRDHNRLSEDTRALLAGWLTETSARAARRAA
jgi:dienelactone hydrolase